MTNPPDPASVAAGLKFDAWITSLNLDVIQDEFGYEEGEFTVYPEQWEPLWREGLTPRQAFRRALDAFAEERAEREREQAANWERVQAEDRDAIARARASSEAGGRG
jgi:hypothetical protein